MEPKQLEPYFSKWEAKWNLDRHDIQQSQIPLKFVVQNGRKIFSTTLKPVPVKPVSPQLKPKDTEAPEVTKRPRGSKHTDILEISV